MAFLKRIYKYFYLNYFYKNNLLVRFNTHVDLKSTFGKNCKLEANSRVSGSKLGENVHVGNGAQVKLSSIGNNISIYNNSIVSYCTLGDFSYIAQNSRIYNSSIGKFSSIGPEVLIGLGKHPTNFISTNPVFYSNATRHGSLFSEKQLFEEYDSCSIGNDVWIGARAIILDGITIGDGAIIAANSVVTKDVEPYSIVGGVSAKFIKYRFSEEKIKELENMKWWDWSADKIKMNIDLFQKKIDSSSPFIKDTF